MAELGANPTPIESIRATVDLFDPERRSALIGNAAIHWELASRGVTADRIRLTDVDAIASYDDLRLMHREFSADSTLRVTASDSRLRATPSSAAAVRGALPFDVITDSDSYDDPLSFTRFGHRIYYNSPGLSKQILEYDGVRYLDLPFILWWKSSLGRPEDLATINRALKALNDHDVFKANERRHLLKAIELGRLGLTLTAARLSTFL